MVAGPVRCDRNRLRLLLEDRLSDGQAEMERHLEGCEECRRQLEALAAEGRWWHEAREYLRSEEPAPEFLDPSEDPAMLGRLGRYEIVEVIGRGGMGVVLKGFDGELSRFVAIKVLAPQLATSAAARQRFAREARAAAAVVHDHVVAIHAVDTTGPLPYLVMPYLAGQSLQARLDGQGPLEVKEILRIGMQVAEGLSAAHAQGLVHRDVKPANILLENGVERVKITDFGLARAVDDASVTHSGFVAGTPQYMAPEQARGEAVDLRSDLFSLGSVLYAMCTGHSPFRAGNTLAVLRRISEDAPRPIRQLNPEVPEWLCEIIEKLLAKEPEDRFASAAEVARLLAEHLAHLQQPLVAPRPRRLGYRSAASRAARRRALRWTMAGVLVVLGAGLGTAAIWHGTRGGWLGQSDEGLGQREAGPGQSDGWLGQSGAMPQGLSSKWTGQTEATHQKPPAGASLRSATSHPSATGRPSADPGVLQWDPLKSDLDQVRQEVGRVEERLRPSPEAGGIAPWSESLRAVEAELGQLERTVRTGGW